MDTNTLKKKLTRISELGKKYSPLGLSILTKDEAENGELTLVPSSELADFTRNIIHRDIYLAGIRKNIPEPDYS